MPEFPIDAFEWSVSHDLSALLNAATYEARYQNSNAQMGWSPTIYDDIELYGGEADPDLVVIRATFDGNTAEVMRGVADRSSREQGPRGVNGVVAGRDKMALALDRYPDAPFTIQGIMTNSGGGVTVIPGQKYREAVQIVAGLAGLSVLWNVGTDDYDIGRTIPVTTEQTFGQILSQLLEPWHLSRKYGHDAWIDGTTLRIVRRDLGEATVSVSFDRLRVNDYHKTRLPAVNDVRVEGATYETIVDDPEAIGEECPGIRETAISVFNADPKQAYTETTAEHLDAFCRLILFVKNRIYGDLIRSELEIKTISYVGNTDRIDNIVREIRETDGRQFSPVPPSNENLGHELVADLREREVTVFSYYEDGDVKTEDVFIQKYGGKDQRYLSGTSSPSEIAYDADATVKDTNSNRQLDTLIESERTVRTYRYIRTAGYLVRFVDQTDTNVLKGTVIRRFGQDEVSPYKVGASTGSTIPRGKKQETAQISCGPTTAKRVETNDMIGDATSACLLRTRIVEEHGLELLDISVQGLPDHNIKAGRRMNITGAPSWFDATNFYILSTEISKGSRGALQTSRGIAFIAL